MLPLRPLLFMMMQGHAAADAADAAGAMAATFIAITGVRTCHRTLEGRHLERETETYTRTEIQRDREREKEMERLCVAGRRSTRRGATRCASRRDARRDTCSALQRDALGFPGFNA